jgi:hypothetical protein
MKHDKQNEEHGCYGLAGPIMSNFSNDSFEFRVELRHVLVQNTKETPDFVVTTRKTN